MTTAARAYVLLEVAIGGALVAIVCATLMSSLADARSRNVWAGRDVVAGQLVQEQIEEARAVGRGNNPTDCPGTAQVATQEAIYQRTCAISTAGSPTNVGGSALAFDTVTVTVQYATSAGNRVTSAATRRYR
jgi:hypothetical protein